MLLQHNITQPFLGYLTCSHQSNTFHPMVPRKLYVGPFQLWTEACCGAQHSQVRSWEVCCTTLHCVCRTGSWCGILIHMKRCCKPSKFLMVSFRKLQHVVGLMSKFGQEDMLSALGFILLRALGHLFMHQQHLNGWVHSSFSSPVHSLIPQTNRNFKVGGLWRALWIPSSTVSFSCVLYKLYKSRSHS